MAFAVSLMAQLCTKNPDRMGSGDTDIAVRLYDAGLGFGVSSVLGSDRQLSHSRSGNALEVYADSSHSPSGERSRQCVIVAWKGSIILWEATRQGFTTLSTAESKLVGHIHAAQVSCHTKS